MIKSVSPTMLRTAALGLLIAGSSLGLKATNLNKENSYMTEPNRTELISREGAEALKVNSIQVVNQSEVPTVHYQKLDATLRKLAVDENDKISINDMLKQVYDVKGTFLGAVYVQHDLNVRALYTFLTGDTKKLRVTGVAPEFADKIDSYGEDFYKTVKPTAETVMNWVFDKYTPYFVNKLNFDHKPTADEVIKKIDSIIKNESALTDEEKQDLIRIAANYKYSKLKDKQDVQSKADLIAYKINLYDTYMFFRELVAAGIYADGYYRRSDKDIRSFYLEWMKNVNPAVFNK